MKAKQVMPFDKADADLKLSRYGSFPHRPRSVAIHEGDLDLGPKATGADVVKHFGFDRNGEVPFLVVTGNLKAGVLNLDDELSQSIGLLVMGKLDAKVVALDMCMLFVFGGANVERAIFFETVDGTLAIAGKTKCPLVIVHEGDYSLRASGIVFDSYNSGPLERDDVDEDDDEDGDDKAWPFVLPTMTCAEARRALVAECWNEEEFDSQAAYDRAVAGKPLLAR
jgi:hypothetical protein